MNNEQETKSPLILNREQVHQLRSAVGCINMANEILKDTTAVATLRLWTDLIDNNAKKCLELLDDDYH